MKTLIKFLFATLLTSSVLSGCAIYKPEVQQGNALSNETVSQLERGMSKGEVASILGTPLLQDNFRDNRWDYVYFDGTGKKQLNKKNLTLIFKNDQLFQVKK
ncbi:UNVERIFIED_CONTAM: hypothetical protein GTU68_021824 [Idotea baltica]|nr:hypothetical protein [Idotea baltica]